MFFCHYSGFFRFSHSLDNITHNKSSKTMMTTITYLIFGFLCVILCLIGFIFGFTYEEISVYVCIYVWPALCVAMPMVIALVALYNWIKKLSLWNTINLALSTGATIVFGIYAKLFYQFYSFRPLLIEGESPVNLDTVHGKFVACAHDLKLMASQLGMTYEEVNLWVYCYLFLAIALVMWLWFEITIPRKWLLNRLWHKWFQ